MGAALGGAEGGRAPCAVTALSPDLTRPAALPTSARLSAAGGSRSRDSAWILRKRPLRSVFCARAWNTLKIVFQKSTEWAVWQGPRAHFLDFFLECYPTGYGL